ncbi:MAG: VIT domain-containing protein [Myxococcota bacterium]
MRSSVCTPALVIFGLVALLLSCRPGVSPLAPHHVAERPPPPAAPASVPSPPVSLTTSDGTGLQLLNMDARVVIEDPLAFTELELLFLNPHATVMEGRFEIRLPQGAQVTRFAMQVGGRLQEAEIVEKQYARQVYEANIHEQRDPALLERDTGNRFRGRVFPIEPHAHKRIILSYAQSLPDPDEPYRLATHGLPTLQRLDVHAQVRDPGQGSHRAVRINQEHVQPHRDILIPRASSPLGGIRRGEHVIARLDPLAGADPAEPRNFRRLTVLFDTSASRALEYDETVQALDRLLHALARHSGTATLQLWAFDQQVVPLYDGPLASMGTSTLSALRARRPLGASNLEAALAALREGERDRVLLVSDGLISAGTESDAQLRRLLAQLARRGVERLDVLRVGSIRDDERLRRLANGPLPQAGVLLDAHGDLERTAERLVRPTTDGLRIDVPGARWWRPRQLDGLQPGDHVLVHAELPAGLPMRVQVTGPVHTEHTVELREVDSPLVDHAWMHGRVQSLIERVASLQDALESEPLRRLAISLSVRHRIFNDFTAFLVLQTEEDYARFGLDRRALGDILRVGPTGVETERRVSPAPDTTESERSQAIEGPSSVSVPIPDDLVATGRPSNSTGEAADPESAAPQYAQMPASNGRDFTQVVESSATASRDSAGISLAGTTGAESKYTVEGANVNAPSFGTVGASAVMRSTPGVVIRHMSGPSRAPTPARVSLSLTRVQGDGLTRRQARSILNGHAHALERCYFRALRRNERLGGRVRVKLRLDTRGTVNFVGKIHKHGLRDVELLRCVDEIFRETTFPSEQGRAPSVFTTLGFVPGDGPPGNAGLDDPTDPILPSATPTPRTLAEIDRALAEQRLRDAWTMAWAWRATAPTNLLAVIALGRVAEARADTELAARAYGSILDLFPSRADMRRYAAAQLEALDEPALDLAIDAYRKARDQRPDHPSSHRNLAWALLHRGDHREAFATLEQGLERDYPPGRFAGVQRVLREDLGIVAAAWLRHDPTNARRIQSRLAAQRTTLPTDPSLRFVLTWETDANDVDLHVIDAAGHDAYHERPSPPSGGELFADVHNGYGPECFAVASPDAGYPYRLIAHYYDRGTMGYGLGKVQIVHHDGEGEVVIEDRPFVILEDNALVDLGAVEPIVVH